MRALVLCAALGVVLTAACDDPFAIGPARNENTVDTLTLFAVNGTPITMPSAVLLATKTRYRLGVDVLPNQLNFDFLYRIDAERGPELAPFGAVVPQTGTSDVGLPGFLETPTPFDEITAPQQTGFTTDAGAALAVGKVLVLRSGVPNGCFLGIPFYGKAEVLSFDETERSVTFKILVNNNCGYRGLAPGFPEK